MTKTPSLKLLLGLMALAGAIIVGIAAYVFTHLHGLDFRETVILVALAVVGLLLIIIVLALFMRFVNQKR
jgi:hypothetical protein